MKVRNPFRMCSPKEGSGKMKAREIRQQKIDSYYAEHPLQDKDAHVSPLVEKAWSMDNKESSVERVTSVDKATSTSSVAEEKKDDTLVNGSQTFETEDLNDASVKATTSGSPQDESSHDESEHEDKEVVYEGPKLVEKSPSMTDTPLCGACGCF